MVAGCRDTLMCHLWLGLANLVGCRRVSVALGERLLALWVMLRHSRRSLFLISGGGDAVETV